MPIKWLLFHWHFSKFNIICHPFLFQLQPTFPSLIGFLYIHNHKVRLLPWIFFSNSLDQLAKTSFKKSLKGLSEIWRSLDSCKWVTFKKRYLITNNIHEKISPFWLVKSSAFFLKTVQKRVNSVQKEETNQALGLVNAWSKKLTDGQSNLLLSDQAHALDGAIEGAISPWLRDTRAFVLLKTISKFLMYIINK